MKKNKTKKNKTRKFPKNFLWGVAYSSHQVEGNNQNDWTSWEEKGKTKEKSGLACDSWNLYDKDHKLAENLGCGGFRMSLEWSRIEPEEGVFSDEAIGHYRKILKNIKKRGIRRVVTLWHWGLPLWFSEKYGWHKKESVEFFSRYCKKVIEELGDEIDIFLTLNEPTVPLFSGYLIGKFPPGFRCFLKFRKARKNMIEAHNIIYDKVKKVKPKLPIGITQLYNYFEPGNNFFLYKFIAKKCDEIYNGSVLPYIKQDFVGIDYYFHNKIKFSFKTPFVIKNDNEKVTDMGWEIYPEGIYQVVKKAWKKYNKPIYIFENGLADAKDKYRADFIREHLEKLHEAIDEGADVRGYFYWSLLDNFEWKLGYGPKFGLCEVDKKTMKRVPRKSYYVYGEIIKNDRM